MGFDIVFVVTDQYRMAGKAIVWMRAFEEVAREQGFRGEHERDPDAEVFGKHYRIELEAAGVRHVLSKRGESENWRRRNLEKVVVEACPAGASPAAFRDSLAEEVKRAYAAFGDAMAAAFQALQEANERSGIPYAATNVSTPGGRRR